MPGIAKDIIEADDIGRRLLQTSLARFKLKNLSFTTP